MHCAFLLASVVCVLSLSVRLSPDAQLCGSADLGGGGGGTVQQALDPGCLLTVTYGIIDRLR